ncbi:hypothetical protein [Lentzea flaviverrucosa]|uniref:Membrane-associated oxidoreductase n=1 Tax=Lentzea flaviverrucosa TaxID=200379 RepID=A0A1H9X5Q2_9PSEU|nr:hypothetical protein [Lentzea flaviverrucosa]RDI20819.1 hypothetical protein DFR72_11436 [Lentzea flaviverrucosa]SES41371.1 hypothetical protein SAMN05216195_113252 [Lentzea flaviverrucosa]
MIRAAEAGEVVDLRRRGDNVLRATVIRDLLRSGDVDPRGILVIGARVTGVLDLDFISTSTALQLDRCVFEEKLSLHDTELPALSLDGSTLPALYAENLRTRYLTMDDVRCAGIVDLENAHVDGTLLFEDSSLGLVYAKGLRVTRNVKATGLLATEVRLDGCDIGGELHLQRAVIVNGSETALVLNNANVGGDIRLDGSFVKATGEDCGVLMLDGSAGALHMKGAVVRTAAHCGICLDGSRFQADVRLNDGIDVRSARAPLGTIRMVDTRIGGSLLVQGTIRNDDGPAVIVQKTAIGATLNASHTVFEANAQRPAVEIDDTDVSGNLVLWPEKLVNHGDSYELSLSGTEVGDLLISNVPKLVQAGVFNVTVNGLTYPEPPDDTDAWLTMLRKHNFRYEAQPYQQLAAVHRAAGHEHTARKVLIAQQRDLRHRGDPGNRVWHWFLGVTLGYGYKPSRAVIGLLVTFLLALCLVWTTNAYNGLTPAKDRPADSCSPVNRISLAADLAIPLVKLGGTPRCELANGPAGQWATGAGWVVQILGWSFATLSVAGFTGLVRKN